MIKNLLVFNAILLACVSNVFSQWNLAPTMLSPSSGNGLVLSETQPQAIRFKVRNLGPNSVPRGRAIHISWINQRTGQIMNFNDPNQENMSSGYILNEDFLDPAEMDMDVNINLTNSQVGDVIRIRVWGAFVGTNLDTNGDPNDTNMSNNITSFTLIAPSSEEPAVSTVDVDLNALYSYPNPVEEELNIVSETSISSVRVIDINGSVVGVYEGQTTINVQNFQSGTYFYQVTTNEGVIKTNKFVKK